MFTGRSASVSAIVCLALLLDTTYGFVPSSSALNRVRLTSFDGIATGDGNRPALSSRWMMTIQSSALSLSEQSDLDDNKNSVSIRSRLRKMTGFSLTALRRTMRLTTGISLTAVYASTLAVTGAWIRQTMKVILAIFPAWLRYFVQPFLVLYYTPLFILRNLTGPTRKRAKSTHEHFIEGWKQAIQTADEQSSYWPVHVEKDGSLKKDIDELDIRDAVAESVEVMMEENTRDKK